MSLLRTLSTFIKNDLNITIPGFILDARMGKYLDEHKVDKETGKGLVETTKIAQIHASGSDNETSTSIETILTSVPNESLSDDDTINFNKDTTGLLHKLKASILHLFFKAKNDLLYPTISSFNTEVIERGEADQFLQAQINGATSGLAGSITHDQFTTVGPVPNPARTCYYEFSTGGTTGAWLSNQVVSAGDRVYVNFTDPDIYVYVYASQNDKVSYTIQQTQTDENKLIARNNIGAISYITKYVKNSNFISEYFSFTKTSTQQYLTGTFYGWAKTFICTSQRIVNGVKLIPTKTMSNMVLSILQLPDDITTLNPPTDPIVVLFEYDITDKWNANIGVETEFYFAEITMLANKNYSIGYRDGLGATAPGFYQNSNTSVMEVRAAYFGGIWNYASKNTVVPFIGDCLFDVLFISTSKLGRRSIETEELGYQSISENNYKPASIPAVALKQESVLPANTTFLVLGKNRFNPNDPDVSIGHFCNWTNGETGTVGTENANYNTTGFMLITAQQNICMTYKHQMAYFNASKVYVSGINSTDLNKIQLVPANVVYCRCTVHISKWASFMCEVSNVPTFYEAFGYKLNSDYLSLSAIYCPRLAVPRYLHVLKNFENSLYHNSYIQRLDDSKYFLHGTGTNWNYFKRFFRANASSYGNLTITLMNALTYAIEITKTITLLQNDNTATNAIKGQIIGDSFAYRGLFQERSNIISNNVTWVGLRKNISNILKAEGRGGWSLNLYSTNPKGYSDTDSFSPFLHLADPYNYYGNTAFWKAVKASTLGYTTEGSIAYNVSAPTPGRSCFYTFNSAGITGSWLGSKTVAIGDKVYVTYANSTYTYVYFATYGLSGFEDICNEVGFDETTGLRSSANVNINDVMYVDNESKYKYYNGSSWVELTPLPAFTFNYEKYLSIWNIEVPDFIAIELGCNDFRKTMLNDTTFASWKAQMDSVINSIKSAGLSLSKTIKVGICLAPTMTATDNNSTSINPLIEHANMFNARYRILNAYDNDVSLVQDNVHIVDTGSAFDSEYGFDIETLQLKPFTYYQGALREIQSYNDPHPDLLGGYDPIGVRLSAWIEEIR